MFSMGGSREYEQAEKAAGARTNELSTRTDATNSKAPGPGGAEACVNQNSALFYQTEGMAPPLDTDLERISRGAPRIKGLGAVVR